MLVGAIQRPPKNAEGKQRDRAIPENAHGNMSKRKRSGLLYFISGLQSMPTRKGNKIFKSYANYNVQQLYNALVEKLVVRLRHAKEPAAPAGQLDANAFQPSHFGPSKLPPLSCRATSPLAPPSVFQADRMALRTLLGKT